MKRYRIERMCHGSVTYEEGCGGSYEVDEGDEYEIIWEGELEVPPTQEYFMKLGIDASNNHPKISHYLYIYVDDEWEMIPLT